MYSERGPKGGRSEGRCEKLSLSDALMFCYILVVRAILDSSSNSGIA
jgi:hypothetical protein